LGDAVERPEIFLAQIVLRRKAFNLAAVEWAQWAGFEKFNGAQAATAFKQGAVQGLRGIPQGRDQTGAGDDYSGGHGVFNFRFF
jgi:hypothetical protein